MDSFIGYFFKETLEARRNYKYIILLAAIMFFSIFDPLMMRLMPLILEGELPKEVIGLINTDRSSSIIGYYGDLAQLASIALCFLASSSLGEEIRERKLIIPLSKGAEGGSIVLAKVCHYVLSSSIVLFLGIAFNYFYTELILEGEMISSAAAISSLLYFALYYIFIISLSIFFSSFITKGFIAAIATLIVLFIGSSLSQINSFGKFLPYNLILRAMDLKEIEFILAIPLTLIYSIVLIALSIVIFNRRKAYTG